MNIKDLIDWSIEHWWWFVLSVALCGCVGAYYYLSTAPRRVVSASIMLRNPDIMSQQGEMMSIMGSEGTKSAADEIEVLTSRDLMEQIVDSLHLNLVVERRCGLRWMPVYPCPDFARRYDQPVVQKQVFRIKQDSAHYRVVVYPHIAAVDMVSGTLRVNRSSRESQIINLAIETANPQQAVDILTMLLGLYNEASSNDKNAVALQSQSFLDIRLTAVQQELIDAENTVEQYKQAHYVGEAGQTAAEYHYWIEDYQRKLAETNLTLQTLNHLSEQLRDSLVNRNMGVLYGHFASAPSMNELISEYNTCVTQRIALMEAANDNNPKILALEQMMIRKRRNIAHSLEQAQGTLRLQQKYLNEQINHYQTILDQMPERERTLAQMLRNKQTKEEQYLYLVQKKEENELMLASTAIPAKLVNRPTMSAMITAPQLFKTAFLVLFFGLLLPLIAFVLRVVYPPRSSL